MFDIVISSLQRALEQFRIDPYWETTAFVGEAIFGGRFILQWLVSEYKKNRTSPWPSGICQLSEASYSSFILCTRPHSPLL